MARIVIFSPHQDDESLNCGGTIHKLVKSGHEVQIIFLTDGSRSHLLELGINHNPTPSELAEVRKKEALSACAILGVSESDIYFLNFKDGCLSDKISEASRAVKEILLLSSDHPLVYICPHQDDLHADHRAASVICQLVANFFSTSPRVYQFVTWGLCKAPDCMEHVIIDICDSIRIKKNAIASYKSQLTTLFSSQSRSILDAEMVKSFESNHEFFFTTDNSNTLANLLSIGSIVVVDAGATKICIGTTSGDANCYCSHTPPESEKLIDTISNNIELFCKSNNISPQNLVVGMCGFIDVDGNLCMSNNLHGVSNPINVKQKLHDRFSIPTHVINDAKLQSLAYIYNYNSYLYLVFGTGAGGAIITNRKIVSGRRGFAGEVCHLPLSNNGVACKCGQNGCLEAATSGRMLLERFGPCWWANITHESEQYLRDLGQQVRHLLFGAGFLFDPDAVIIAGHLVTCAPFREALTAKNSSNFDFSLILESDTWNTTLRGARNLLLRKRENERIFT